MDLTGSAQQGGWHGHPRQGHGECRQPHHFCRRCQSGVGAQDGTGIIPDSEGLRAHQRRHGGAAGQISASTRESAALNPSRTKRRTSSCVRPTVGKGTLSFRVRPAIFLPMSPNGSHSEIPRTGYCSTIVLSARLQASAFKGGMTRWRQSVGRAKKEGKTLPRSHVRRSGYSVGVIGDPEWQPDMQESLLLRDTKLAD